MKHLLFYYCDDVSKAEVSFPIAMFSFNGVKLTPIKLDKRYIKSQCKKYDIDYKFVMAYVKSISADFENEVEKSVSPVYMIEDVVKYFNKVFVNNFRFKEIA